MEHFTMRQNALRWQFINRIEAPSCLCSLWSVILLNWSRKNDVSILSSAQFRFFIDVPQRTNIHPFMTGTFHDQGLIFSNVRQHVAIILIGIIPSMNGFFLHFLFFRKSKKNKKNGRINIQKGKSSETAFFQFRFIAFFGNGLGFRATCGN